jgi:hypothetical protein
MTDMGNITFIQINFSNPLPSDYQGLVLNRTMESILNQSGFTIVNNTTVKGSNEIYTILI